MSESLRPEPLKKVLVPVNFSNGASTAFRRALLLPLAEGASLHAIHVLPPDLPATAQRRAAAEAKDTLDLLLSAGRETVADRHVTLTSEVVTGEPFVEIIRTSRIFGVELIVLGRHGARPIRDMFISTTAERVVRNGDVPVLVVNLKPRQPYRRPLITTDLRDTSPRTFELALRILGPTTREIAVVHAFQAPFEAFVTPLAAARERSEYRLSFERSALTRLHALLSTYDGLDVHWRTTLRAGDARAVILAAAVRQRADLVVLGTHGRSGIAHTLLGSVAERVVAAAPCDVLVARPVRYSFDLLSTEMGDRPTESWEHEGLSSSRRLDPGSAKRDAAISPRSRCKPGVPRGSVGGAGRRSVRQSSILAFHGLPRRSASPGPRTGMARGEQVVRDHAESSSRSRRVPRGTPASESGDERSGAGEASGR